MLSLVLRAVEPRLQICRLDVAACDDEGEMDDEGGDDKAQAEEEEELKEVEDELALVVGDSRR